MRAFLKQWRVIKVGVLYFLLGSFALFLSAQPYNQELLLFSGSARTEALGSSTASNLSDATAVLLNPARLPAHPESLLTLQSRLGSDAVFLSLTRPFKGFRLGAGILIHQTPSIPQTDAQGEIVGQFTYHGQLYTFAAAKAIGNLSVGLAFKALRQGFLDESLSVNIIDLGVSAKVTPSFTASFVSYGLFGTDLKVQSASQPSQQEPHLSALGLSLSYSIRTPPFPLLLSASALKFKGISPEPSGGAEISLLQEAVKLRFGIRKDKLSLGVGINLHGQRVDVSLTRHSALGSYTTITLVDTNLIRAIAP